MGWLSICLWGWKCKWGEDDGNSPPLSFLSFWYGQIFSPKWAIPFFFPFSFLDFSSIWLKTHTNPVSVVNTWERRLSHKIRAQKHRLWSITGRNNPEASWEAVGNEMCAQQHPLNAGEIQLKGNVIRKVKSNGLYCNASEDRLSAQDSMWPK